MSTNGLPTWQKSSHCSEGNNCLELAAPGDGTALLRESDEPGAVLATTPDRLRGLLALARCGMPWPR